MKSPWNFLQLYYVTRVVFTGDDKETPLSVMCRRVKKDTPERLIRKWYDRDWVWDELRQAYGNDDSKVCDSWFEYLETYRRARKLMELEDVSKRSEKAISV